MASTLISLCLLLRQIVVDVTNPWKTDYKMLAELSHSQGAKDLDCVCDVESKDVDQFDMGCKSAHGKGERTGSDCPLGLSSSSHLLQHSATLLLILCAYSCMC